MKRWLLILVIPIQLSAQQFKPDSTHLRLETDSTKTVQTEKTTFKAAATKVSVILGITLLVFALYNIRSR